MPSSAIPPDERRRFSRVAFAAQAAVIQDGRRYPVQLLDISVNGALVTAEDPAAITGKPASLNIELADGVIIGMQILLMHHHRDHLGFQCESIDIDSATHLRRLIELNLNSNDASERVLEELVASASAPPEATGER